MRLIERYLFSQLLAPTLLAVVALTIVAMLSQSLSALDVIVDQRQSLLVLLKITGLALPALLSLILPVAVFVAAILSLNRLHTEQEVVVCFAGGMSRWEVIAPAIRLAAGCALVSLSINLWVQPPAARALRAEIFRVRADLAASLVQPGEFSEPAPGLTVFAQSESPSGALKNLFVHQQRANGSTTFGAREGQISKRNGAPILIMRHGSSQEFSKNGVLNFLSFDEYALDLAPFLARDADVHFKTSDRWLHELIFPDLSQAWERQYRRKLLAEGNSRLAAPLYNLALMAVALAAVLGGPFSRLGYGRRIALASLAAALVRIAGFGAQGLAIQSVWLNLLQYIVPIGTMAVCANIVFHQKVRRFIPRGASRPAAQGALS
jgi:lipopolysaccharide export system permease protein